ncbi:MAG: hypothetical protein WC393_03710 [Candidatus Nanoarchaeia archaeon]|jgi:hypothetical protein
MKTNNYDTSIIALSASLHHFPSHKEYLCSNNHFTKQQYDAYIKANFKWLNEAANPNYWNNVSNLNRAINYLTANSKNEKISRTTFEKFNLRGLLEKYYGSVYLLLKISYPKNETLNHEPWKLTKINHDLMLKQLPIGYFYNPSNSEFFNKIQKNNSINNFIRAVKQLDKNYELSELSKKDYIYEGLGNLIYSFKKMPNIIEFYEEHKHDRFIDNNKKATLEEVITARNYDINPENIILPTTYIRNKTKK